MRFMKMHGAGNDFVVMDTRGHGPVSAGLARALGDRNRGVGFDQLAEIMAPTGGADIDLRFWNADGSTAGACGNATRCVAAHLMAKGGTDRIAIRTERGVLQCEMRGNAVWVNMGPPQLDWADIPLARAADTDHLPLDGDPAGVGMGNPHCVFFVSDIASVDVAGRGGAIEHHPLFPRATNVEFAQVRSDSEIRMRVWERGTGITLACGSGACATAVAAHRRGLTGRRVSMEVDGGWLDLEITDDGVWMSGPTAHVFDGVLTRAFVESVAG
jgi:diaminopimelate epimerase